MHSCVLQYVEAAASTRGHLGTSPGRITWSTPCGLRASVNVGKVFSPCETRRAQQDERDKRDEHAARKQHTRREEQGNEEHEHEELRQRDTDKKQAAPARMAATMTGKLRARRASSRPICTHEKPSGGRVSSGGDAPATVSLSRDRRAGGGWERAPSLVRRRGWRVGRTEGADQSPVAKAPLEARTALSIAGETYPTHK